MCYKVGQMVTLVKPALSTGTKIALVPGNTGRVVDIRGNLIIVDFGLQTYQGIRQDSKLVEPAQ